MLKKDTGFFYSIPVFVSAALSICFFIMVLLSKLTVTAVRGSALNVILLIVGTIVWLFCLGAAFLLLKRVKLNTAAMISILVVVALAVRLAVIFFLPAKQDSDFQFYYNLAVNFIHGDGIGQYRDYIVSIANYAVIFSSLLSVFFSVFGESVLTALLVNTAFAVLTVVMFFFICRNFVSKTTAFFCAICLSLWPSIILHHAFVATEPSFLFFLMLGLLLFLKAVKPHKKVIVSVILVLGAGLTLSAGNEIRPIGLVFFLTLLLYLSYLFFKKKDMRKRFLISAVVYVAAFFFLSAASKSYITSVVDTNLPTTNYGWSLYEGTNPISWGVWNETTCSELGEVTRETPNKADVQKILLNRALERLKTYDIKTLAKMEVYKAYNMWSGDNHSKDMMLTTIDKNSAAVDITRFPNVLNAIVNNWYYAFLVLFLLFNAGIFINCKRGILPDIKYMIFMLPVSGLILIHSLLTSIDRYKYSVLPLFIIAAAVVLDQGTASKKLCKTEDSHVQDN